ncbi:MAG: DUF1939 domain-containing protein [Candidatus Heimdallarchaeota archaeon]|nr:MAG: DUF1939 domain-containing protein [Candidatus Heimdallarchaeota archaeon]
MSRRLSPIILLLLFQLSLIFSLVLFNISDAVPESKINQKISFGSGVMLQAFYWDTPSDWYTIVTEQIPEIKNAGFDAIWLPPPSKGHSGGYSMGYDPYDYYDLGEFFQHGTTPTRFGTKIELLALTTEAHNYELAVVGDIVLNHNSGGASEWNPNINDYTWTDFTGLQSGKFLRSYNDFHPSSYEEADEGIFGGFPDLCHANPYVHDELIKWGQWLRDEIGFDSWRFDYVKGFHASMVQDWMTSVGGWGVAEYWDGYLPAVLQYLDDTNNVVSGFDFPLYYILQDLCNSDGTYDMGNLANSDYRGVMGTRPFQSVTFVANHDTNEIAINKMMAYAFILTAEGYPCVFWNDWVDPNFKEKINTLILIHNQFAKGGTDILYTNDDLYVAQRNGDPGCLVVLNDGSDWSGVTVQTKWSNTLLKDLTGQAFDEETDSEGNVEVWAPPKGYTVFAPGELEETTFTTVINSTTSSTSISTTSPSSYPTSTESTFTETSNPSTSLSTTPEVTKTPTTTSIRTTSATARFQFPLLIMLCGLTGYLLQQSLKRNQRK